MSTWEAGFLSPGSQSLATSGAGWNVPDFLADFRAVTADAVGNLYAEIVVPDASPLPGDPVGPLQANASTTLPGPGTYLVRGGASGYAMLPSPPAPWVPDDEAGAFFFGPLATATSLGSCMLVPTSSTSGFVARLGPSWQCLWSAVLPVPALVTPDGSGGAVLSTTSTAPIDLGCGTLPADPGGSTFVTRLDAAGACIFGESFPTPSLAVEVDPAGYLVLSGHVGAGPVDLGGGYRWSHRFGSAALATLDVGVWLPTTGDVVLTTAYAGAVDFGGGVVTAAAGDLVVASFSSAGSLRWSRALTIAGSYDWVIDGCGGLVAVSIDPAFDPGAGPVIPNNDAPGPGPPFSLVSVEIGFARFQP